LQRNASVWLLTIAAKKRDDNRPPT
jgi:hypothetical protein